MEELEEIKYPGDMSLEEIGRLKMFVRNKLPDIGRVMESDIFQWFELYMAGKTYAEIADLSESKLSHILYIADKQKWHDKRIEHYGALIDNMRQKVTEATLDSANTIATMVAGMNRYYKKKFDGYLAKGRHDAIEELDTKLLSQYYKSIDMLEKIMNPKDRKPPSDGETVPGVNIIIGSDSGTIKTADGKSLEITDDNAGKILEAMAGAKKEEID